MAPKRQDERWGCPECIEWMKTGGEKKNLPKEILSRDEIDEEEVGSAMYLPSLPDVDLVVRTSGEKRLSGFLLWHSKSSKLYFTEKFWPEFEREDLIGAIEAWRNSLLKGSDGVGL